MKLTLASFSFNGQRNKSTISNGNDTLSHSFNLSFISALLTVLVSKWKCTPHPFCLL